MTKTRAIHLRFFLWFCFSCLFFQFLPLQVKAADIRAITLAGFLVKLSNGEFNLVSSEDKQIREILPSNVDVVNQLNKLDDRDFIVGTGEVRSGKILLDSVDFVGLHRLLGVWMSDSIMFNFRSFSLVNMSWGDEVNVGKTAQLNYSIAPTSFDSWQIFFSDVTQVQIATLTVDRQKARLDFYDKDTGEISKTYLLRKVIPYRLDE